MAMAASGIIGMYRVTVSPLPIPMDFRALASWQVRSYSSR